MEQFTPPPRGDTETSGNQLAPKDLAEELSAFKQLKQQAASARGLHGPGSPEEANLQRQIEIIPPIVREISDLEDTRDSYFAKIDAARELHGAGSPEEASLRVGIDHTEARLNTLLNQYYGEN
jgi:hypothetical protein